jgi:MFS transporter, PAT family, beta-lactamase induction signal transducer AmpG
MPVILIMPSKSPNSLINMRLLAVLLLGFSSGLPLALTGSTLQAWFTEAHINLATIGALSLLGIPYTLKFLWAPLLDHYSFPRLGKRRGWIMATQFCLVVSLLLLANMNPGSQAMNMTLLALLIAFFSASQDIAYDAYRADALLANERGLGAAYTVFGYRIAVLFSGGLALVFADYLGWKTTYECMAFLVFVSMMAAYKAPQPTELAPTSPRVFSTIVASLNDLLQREKIVLLLLFIMLYKFGDALALSLMTNFLLHGLGFSLTEVGLAYKVVSFLATIFGAFVGGIFLTRWTMYRALLLFGLAQAFSNLMFVILAMVGKDFILMSISIFIENFCSGLSTAALLAFMMSLCNHRYTAGQFALLSAVASLARVFLGPLAAFMVENGGWVQFYIWSFVLCFPGILILIILKDRVLSHAPAIAD